MSNPPESTLKVYEFIRDHIEQYGYGPSLREMAAACFMSHSAILRHLDRLEGLWWIIREQRKARSITLGPSAPDYYKRHESQG